MRMVGWRRDVGGCCGCDVCCAALLLSCGDELG